MDETLVAAPVQPPDFLEYSQQLKEDYIRPNPSLLATIQSYLFHTPPWEQRKQGTLKTYNLVETLKTPTRNIHLGLSLIDKKEDTCRTLDFHALESYAQKIKRLAPLRPHEVPCFCIGIIDSHYNTIGLLHEYLEVDKATELKTVKTHIQTNDEKKCKTVVINNYQETNHDFFDLPKALILHHDYSSLN